jgi:hypothetical protein
MYNKGKIKVQSTAKKKTKNSPWSKDAIMDPAGQWKFPGQVTKIPSGDITMQGVNYPVFGVDNLGNEQMMMPGGEYQFPGNMVTEYPMMQVGGQTDPYLDQEEAIRNYEAQLAAERERVSGVRNKILPSAKRIAGMKNPEMALSPNLRNWFKTEWDNPDTAKPWACNTYSCQAMRNAGVTTATDFDFQGRTIPAGSPLPIIPGNAQFNSLAEQMGFALQPRGTQPTQPGDLVRGSYSVSGTSGSQHSLLSTGQQGPKGNYKMYNSPGDYDEYTARYPGASHTRQSDFAKTGADRVMRYVGNIPNYEQQLADAQAKLRTIEIQKVAPMQGSIPTPESNPQLAAVPESNLQNTPDLSKKELKNYFKQMAMNKKQTPPGYHQMPDGNIMSDLQMQYGRGGQPCYECGGNVHYQAGGGTQDYNDLKAYHEKMRQAIGTNDTATLRANGLTRPYGANELSGDFHNLQQARQAQNFPFWQNLKEEAGAMFPHVGQQIRGTFNQVAGTNFANGGEAPMNSTIDSVGQGRVDLMKNFLTANTYKAMLDKEAAQLQEAMANFQEGGDTGSVYNPNMYLMQQHASAIGNQQKQWNKDWKAFGQGIGQTMNNFENQQEQPQQQGMATNDPSVMQNQLGYGDAPEGTSWGMDEQGMQSSYAPGANPYAPPAYHYGGSHVLPMAQTGANVRANAPMPNQDPYQQFGDYAALNKQEKNWIDAERLKQQAPNNEWVNPKFSGFWDAASDPDKGAYEWKSRGAVMNMLAPDLAMSDPRRHRAIQNIIPGYGGGAERSVMSSVADAFFMPQKMINEMFTGYYEFPSETYNRYVQPEDQSEIARFALDMATDPLIMLGSEGPKAIGALPKGIATAGKEIYQTGKPIVEAAGKYGKQAIAATEKAAKAAYATTEKAIKKYGPKVVEYFKNLPYKDYVKLYETYGTRASQMIAKQYAEDNSPYSAQNFAKPDNFSMVPNAQLPTSTIQAPAQPRPQQIQPVNPQQMAGMSREELERLAGRRFGGGLPQAQFGNMPASNIPIPGQTFNNPNYVGEYAGNLLNQQDDYYNQLVDPSGFLANQPAQQPVQQTQPVQDPTYTVQMTDAQLATGESPSEQQALIDAANKKAVTNAALKKARAKLAATKKSKTSTTQAIAEAEAEVEAAVNGETTTTDTPAKKEGRGNVKDKDKKDEPKADNLIDNTYNTIGETGYGYDNRKYKARGYTIDPVTGKKQRFRWKSKPGDPGRGGFSGQSRRGYPRKIKNTYNYYGSNPFEQAQQAQQIAAEVAANPPSQPIFSDTERPYVTPENIGGQGVPVEGLAQESWYGFDPMEGITPPAGVMAQQAIADDDVARYNEATGSTFSRTSTPMTREEEIAAYEKARGYRNGGATYPGAQPFGKQQSYFYANGGGYNPNDPTGMLPKAQFGLPESGDNAYANYGSAYDQGYDGTFVDDSGVLNVDKQWQKDNQTAKIKTKDKASGNFMNNANQWAPMILPAMDMISSIAEAKKAKGWEKDLQQMRMSDNIFSVNDQTNRGKNTPNQGYFDPANMVPVQFAGNNQGSPGSYNQFAQQGGVINPNYGTPQEMNMMPDSAVGPGGYGTMAEYQMASPQEQQQWMQWANAQRGQQPQQPIIPMQPVTQRRGVDPVQQRQFGGEQEMYLDDNQIQQILAMGGSVEYL